MDGGRRRREFLRAGLVGSVVGLSGCASEGDTTPRRTASRSVTSRSGTPTDSPTDTATETATPTAVDRAVYHVAPDGDESNDGSAARPLGTIQQALQEATAGDEIRLASGEYRKPVRTVNGGAPDAPITIMGPPDAVQRRRFHIQHSHIHLRGFTLDGLRDPTAPDNPTSYERVLVHSRPTWPSDEYLEDIVCAPAGIGNSRRPLMLFERTKNLEVGPLEVIGLAGASYLKDDSVDSHVGEIVYLGQPPSTVERDDYPWDELDQTRNVHVHHIDNSAGHPHSELVNAKLGTRDVLVEYCTSAGGSQNEEPYPSAEVRFQSHDATLRWCDLRNGQGTGVHVVHHRPWLKERDDPAVTPTQSGTNHSIYGNRLAGFSRRPILLSVPADEQRAVCGNSLPDADSTEFAADCSADLPTGAGIGHTAGGD